MTTAVTLVAEESAPSPSSSAESNFRELDDAFLQTQTRIWLGEVLQIRFDEQVGIADLLADGEILFEVSEVISKMLPNLGVDATHPKLNEWKSPASSKSTRRYKPYYNVGAFLLMCKNLGLDSIDLFTPSDVVEKRNTRKVCICLRALSKKVTSRDLIVPDFDSVTCTLSMPTDMVQYIRKSLERSQSSSPVSVEKDSDSRIGYWQRMSNSVSPVSNAHSDNGDNAESSLMVFDSHGSTNHTCDVAFPIILGPEMVREDESEQQLQLNMDLEDEGDVEDEYLSPPESVGSPCSEYYSDQNLSSTQSTCLGSRIDGKVWDVDTMGILGYQNADVKHVPIDLGDSSWDIQNYRDDSAIDEDDDVHNEEDKGKTQLNACSPVVNVHMKDLTCPSEIGCENNSYDDIEPVCCTNSFSVGDGELNVPYGMAVEDDLCADEGPISESESIEDEPVASNDDVGNSYSDDLCVVEDDFVDDTPTSKFKCLGEQQMEVEEETFHNELVPESRESHFNEKGNANDLSSESLTHPTEAIHDEVISSYHSLNYDVVGQVTLHAEQCLCKVDSGKQSFHCSCPVVVKSSAIEDHWLSPRFSDESCLPFHLLPDIDTIISANIHLSPTKNENKVFDANVITSDHIERCLDNNSRPSVDLGPFPSMIVNMDGMKCPNKVCQGTQNEFEDHNVVAKNIETKPMNIEDTQAGYEDVNVLTKNVIGNDKPISTELESYVNSSSATPDNPQLGADSPRTDDTGNNHNPCVETMEKGESENIEVEDKGKKIQLRKPQRKFLKSFIKGTALVGIAVFLLHLRKNIKPSVPKENQQPTEAVTRKPVKPSSEKVQKASTGNTSSIYPAERLRLDI